jgi:sulfate adenylyltransferase (ADP) / ATP adenylyltransferase
MLEPGRLWERLTAVSEAALRSGAQVPVPTEYVRIEDQGIPFIVRVLSALEKKRQARQEQSDMERVSGRKINPFLPYEEALFVADLSETHLCLLNKFNVLAHHLLIVTRAYEDQESLLTKEDFLALWTCMREYDGLGFYNGGEPAGASQSHKHLQIVPLPMTQEGPRVPLEPALADASFRQGVGTSARFPWVHGFVLLPPQLMDRPQEAASFSLQGYQALLEAAGLAAGKDGTKQAGPYNLLMTREWMLLVPRSRECSGSISVNALGFAGALLVKNREEMEHVRERGPMEVLRTVGVPAGGP